MNLAQIVTGPMILGLLIASASIPTEAADTALTLQGAQKVAIDRSRLLNSKDYAAAAARDMATAAGELPDPVLKFGIDNVPVEGAERFSMGRDSMTMRRIGVMQDLPRAEKRKLRSQRFEREAEKSVAEKAALSAAIERDTAIAWLNLYYTQRMAALVSEQLDLARQEIKATEAAYRSGTSRQAEILGAHSNLAQLENRKSEIERRVRDARIALARWVGEAAHLPIAGEPDINLVRVDLANVERELNHHPELTVAARQEEIAIAEANLARANRKADWSVELAFQQRGSAYSNMVSLGVSIPLQWNQKNRQDRELSARLAQVEEASAVRDELLRAHVAELEAMINEWKTNQVRHARYARELIPLAHSRVEAQMASYRGGKASQAEVLMAKREETEVRLEALELETEIARLWAQIDFLIPDKSRSHTPSVSN
jgi:outer membrane protein TolC